jgi:hypothetical protein
MQEILRLDPYTFSGKKPIKSLSSLAFGKAVRADLNLAAVDVQRAPCRIVIPSHVDYVGNDFLDGLFGESLATLKDEESFWGHYQFTVPEIVMGDIHRGIALLYRA